MKKMDKPKAIPSTNNQNEEEKRSSKTRICWMQHEEERQTQREQRSTNTRIYLKQKEEDPKENKGKHNILKTGIKKKLNKESRKTTASNTRICRKKHEENQKQR